MKFPAIGNDMKLFFGGGVYKCYNVLLVQECTCMYSPGFMHAQANSVFDPIACNNRSYPPYFQTSSSGHWFMAECLLQDHKRI